VLDPSGVTAQLQNNGSTSVHQPHRLTKRPSVDSGIHLGSVQSSDSLPSLRSRGSKLSGGRETPKLSRFVFTCYHVNLRQSKQEWLQHL